MLPLNKKIVNLKKQILIYHCYLIEFCFLNFLHVLGSIIVFSVNRLSISLHIGIIMFSLSFCIHFSQVKISIILQIIPANTFS